MPNPAFGGQFGPENKLIEGQPNEYDVICRKASVLVFHLWPTICRSAKIFVGTASHRVPAPLHPCILYPITNRSLKTAEIGICTPLKLNICFMFVLETANVEVGTSHISEPTGKIWWKSVTRTISFDKVLIQTNNRNLHFTKIQLFPFFLLLSKKSELLNFYCIWNFMSIHWKTWWQQPNTYTHTHTHLTALCPGLPG